MYLDCGHKWKIGDGAIAGRKHDDVAARGDLRDDTPDSE